MAENDSNMLELLIHHELAIKTLYEVFASLFPERQTLWQDLAKDEQRHADWLGVLRSGKGLDPWLRENIQLKPQAVHASIRYVETQAQRAREKQLNGMQALAIARDIESALIEKQFSRIGASVPEEVRSVLVNLATETDRHRKIVTEALNSERG